MVSWPWNLGKLTEALLDTDNFPYRVAYVAKNKANREMDVKSKREKQIRKLAWTAKKAVSARLYSRSESPPTDIFDDKTNKKNVSDKKY